MKRYITRLVNEIQRRKGMIISKNQRKFISTVSDLEIEECLKKKPIRNESQIDKNHIYIIEADGEKYDVLADRLMRAGHAEGVDFISNYRYDIYINHSKSHINPREWRENEYFTDNWMDRIKVMFDMLDDDCLTFLDIGCGSGNALKYITDNSIHVDYYGLDYIRRSQDTIICDLNNHEFPEERYDTFFCSGAMEYVEDIGWFMHNLNQCNRQFLLSYCTMERTPDIFSRINTCWKSHVTLLEIIRDASAMGFKLFTTQKLNYATIIMDFRRNFEEA